MPFKISKFDYILIIGLVLMMLNVLLITDGKGINYLLAYSVIFGSYLLINGFQFQPIEVNKLLRVNYYGINLICVYLIVEVLGKLFFDVNFFDWVPRSSDTNAVVTAGLFRAYGLASEPTQVGNYFCCFFPFAMFYASLNKTNNFKWYILFLFFSAMLTFSAAMFAVGTASLILYFCLSNSRQTFLKMFLFVGSVFFVSVFLIIAYLELGNLIIGAFETLLDKFTLGGAGTSSSQRISYLNRGLNDIFASPLLGTGLGTASFKGLGSNINWYIFLAAEGGLIILSIFVVWFLSFMIHALINYRLTRKKVYLIAGTAIFGGMAYFVFLSTFQNLYLLSAILLYRLILNAELSLNNGDSYTADENHSSLAL